MFDIWWGGVELTTLTLILSFVILLPLQLLLCFKTKSRTLRLLPIIILSAAAVVFLGINFAAPRWTGLVFLFLAIFTAFMDMMCGVGWGIWAMVRFIKRNN